ncbi:hypothetical protein Ancab_003996 [Ancistrocladus abbreviatus]
MESSEANLTVTQREQRMVEGQVFAIYKHFGDLPPRAQTVMLELARDQHIEYFTNGLRHIGSSFCVLDANRPWLCYWILHSLALLGESIDEELENSAIDFLNRCQDPNGGYGGGPGQMPHLATTYAAVNSLVTIGGHRSLSSINRDKLYSFLQRMKDPSGGFRMHEGGEMDVRACYTAISVASILNILDYQLVENVGDYIVSSQTYEGGIAGEPGSEAHGGYTFCGLATMILISQVHRLDVAGLIGGVFPLIQRLEAVIDNQLARTDVGKQDGLQGCNETSGRSISSERKRDLEGPSSQFDENQRGNQGLPNAPDLVNLSEIGLSFVEQHAEMGPLFHSLPLQQYILLCSQVPNGGFRDKPGKPRDYYHSCYCLSGLVVAQYSWSKDADSSPLPQELFGPYSNLLEQIHPLYNVAIDRYHEAREFFLSS